MPVLKKLSELQENSERWFNDIFKKRDFSKEIKIIKKNKTETEELKNSMNEMEGGEKQ